MSPYVELMKLINSPAQQKFPKNWDCTCIVLLNKEQAIKQETAESSFYSLWPSGSSFLQILDKNIVLF